MYNSAEKRPEEVGMNVRRALLSTLCLVLGAILLAGIVPARTMAQAFADVAFQSVWQRADKPVANGLVTRSWVWGPQPFTAAFYEAYAESPGGTRLVQYFDKSRMEINDPTADRGGRWFVTNGLLVREMVDGRIVTGASSFTQAGPAQEAVAGDDAAVNPNCPTYATFQFLSSQRAESRVGQAATTIIAKEGATWDDPTKAFYAGTTMTYYDETLGHNVPQVFWDYMNQSGVIYEGGSYRTGQVVDWLFAFGYPITEPYWVRAMVGGVEKDVLVQLFERRVLTYTPSNAAGWQVEMGNVGRHYYSWRYGSAPPPVPPSDAHAGQAVKTADSDTIYLVENGVRRAFPDWDTFVAMGWTLDRVEVISREQLASISLGEPLPSTHVCQGGMAKVNIRNLIAAELQLSLTGPEAVRLSIPANTERNLCLYAGSYLYYGSAPGFGSFDNRIELTGGDCQCWDWVVATHPVPACSCSNNMADYGRP
jgi:hypothetical protein